MKNALAIKVIEGLDSQGWELLGKRGTWAGAMRPLEVYIQRKVERAVKAEQDRCCRIIYGMAGSDNVAQRTVEKIRSKE